jgi:NADH-quinone oxidoreductase subunit N
MNAPILWIVVPGVAAGIFYLLRKYKRLVQSLAIALTLFLALLAWQLPIGVAIPLGPWPALPKLVLTESISFLGRQFLINDSARPALMIIYLGSALWFIGAATIPISRLFFPLGLAIAALLTAVISVQPFIYAALLIQMAVIVSVPILSPPGKPVPAGVIRFIIFQTIGMFLLVFSGWIVSSIEINANDPILVLRASVLLGLGFAMTMSVFPFNTWIPMVAKETHPYAAAFVFFTLPEVITLFAFNVFGRYSWLQTAPLINQFFTLVGLIMITGGGFWSIFQNNLGRIFGYAVITEIGLSMIAIGQIITTYQIDPISEINLITKFPLAEIFFALLLPRGLNLAIWALALSIIKATTMNLDFQSVGGKAYQFPFAVISLSLAGFSLAGFPLLAGYPVRTLLGAVIAQESPLIAGFSLVGYFGLVLATIRSIFVLFKSQEGRSWMLTETRSQLILLGLGCLILLIIGVFPSLFLSSRAILFP